MDELSVFNYDGNEVRTVFKDGEPWWVLKDVCTALGLSDTNKVAERLDGDELTRFKIVSGGQMREVYAVSESGLYNVIIRSDKPEAKAFKRWVTHEVLPSIRKHGAYMTPQTIERVLYDPDFLLQLATKLKEQKQEIELKDEHIKKLAPKAEFYDTIIESKDAICIGDAAKVLGKRRMGRNNLFAELRKRKILDSRNVPYQKYVDAGYFRVIETKYVKANGEVKINFKTLVHQRGLDYIRKSVGA